MVSTIGPTAPFDGSKRQRGRPRDAASRVLLHLDVLVVDDQEHLDCMCDLTSSGLEVTWCRNGADALVVYGRTSPQVVLIAPSLPDLAPAEVIGAMRRHGAPTIFVGLAGDIEITGAALMAGGSALVSRPYDADEIMRRLFRTDLAPLPGPALQFGPLHLDARSHSVRVAGAELEPFPCKEFDLLACLMRHADRVVSPAQIKALLWPSSEREPSDNTVGVHVHRLRKRLPRPLVVRTVRGLGYRLTLGT